jgi:hypothetical protein
MLITALDVAKIKKNLSDDGEILCGPDGIRNSDA